MAKTETEARQGSARLSVHALAEGLSSVAFSNTVKKAGPLLAQSWRSAVVGVGGAAAMVALAGTAHAGQPVEPSQADAHTQSGAPLTILASANADAAEANDVPEALDAPKMMRVSARLQCVPYARDASGVQIRGNANTWWRQAASRYERTNQPADGRVIVMRGYNNPNRGHVAVVSEVLSDRSILIDHANWLNSGEITVNVPVVDVSANNDWSQVRVWHIPTQSWGVRVYNVQGFIVPGEAPRQGGPVTHIAR
jgi:surface antigen